MAPRSIYTRRFPDLDPERILRRSNTQAEKGISHLQRASYLHIQSVRGFTSCDFDKGTDQSFSRTKSNIELCQVQTDLERPNIFRPTQHPSHLSPMSAIQNPITYSVVFVSPLIPAYAISFPNPPIVMTARYDHLVLPAQLHDLPQGYSQRIKIYDQENMYDKGESAEPEPTYLTQLAGKDIIQLKIDSFPRGLVPLKGIFDSNDVAKSPKVAPRDDEVEECKIGTEKDPKVIKIAKNMTQESKEKYIKLMKEFYDVFVWTYDDLKVYDPGVI